MIFYKPWVSFQIQLSFCHTYVEYLLTCSKPLVSGIYCSFHNRLKSDAHVGDNHLGTYDVGFISKLYLTPTKTNMKNTFLRTWRNKNSHKKSTVVPFVTFVKKCTKCLTNCIFCVYREETRLRSLECVLITGVVWVLSVYCKQHVSVFYR